MSDKFMREFKIPSFSDIGEQDKKQLGAFQVKELICPNGSTIGFD